MPGGAFLRHVLRLRTLHNLVRREYETLEHVPSNNKIPYLTEWLYYFTGMRSHSLFSEESHEIIVGIVRGIIIALALVIGFVFETVWIKYTGDRDTLSL